MKHKQRKKASIEKQKKANKPVSIRFNLQSSPTKRRLELLQYAKEKLTAVKEIKFPYADMHGNLKVVLNTPIRNRYVVGFKTKEDVGQILTSLGTDNYEGISYEAFLFGRVIGMIIQYHYVLNQVSLLSNSRNLSVAWKNFTTTQSLTPVSVCVRILPMSYQCYGVVLIVF